jgi:hypothetical protein
LDAKNSALIASVPLLINNDKKWQYYLASISIAVSINLYCN